MSFWPTGLQIVTAPGEVVTSKRKHTVLIHDQSGSMGWAISDVAQDMIRHLDDFDEDDVISLGWFSGPGQFRFYGIGLSLRDKARIAQLINDNAKVRGMTCFSEILIDLKEVIDQTRALADLTNLVFVSDGYPTVADAKRENTAIFAAISAVKDSLSEVRLVGYGHYYNRPLMVEMAKAFGGSLQHAENVEVFGDEVAAVAKASQTPLTVVSISDDATLAFTVSADGSLVVRPINQGTVAVPQGSAVYTVSPSAPAVTDAPEEDALAASYAVALAHCQQGDIDAAVALLSRIGDVLLTTRLASALTNREIGGVADLIKAAIHDPDARFQGGRRENCLPDENAPDLLDVFNLLSSSSAVKFHPFDPHWQYKRIGRASKPQEGFAKFNPDRTQGVPMVDLVIPADELNMSVRAVIKGTVTFTDPLKAQAVGFAPVFPVITYRNYAIVADGALNVPMFPISIAGGDEGERVFTELSQMGLVDTVFTPDALYLLNLADMPICNRAKTSAGVSAQQMGEIAVQSTLVAARLNALGALRKELDPEKKFTDTSYTVEQEEFLRSQGIRDGVYAPPSTEEDPTDVVNVRTFQVKVGKFSSFPKLADVREMIDPGTKKKLTPSGAAVAVALIDAEQTMPKGSLTEKLRFLDREIEYFRGDRRVLQAKINEQRFAMALTGKWFVDLGRDQNTVSVPMDQAAPLNEPLTVTFEVGSKQRKI